jgi:hypothetical protein
MVMIDSSFYVLDGTDKETPSHLIPERVMYTEGLLINKMDYSRSFTDQDFGWVSIFNNKQKFYKVVNISAEMNSEGKITGQAFIMNSEYARLNTLKAWKAEKEKFKEDFTNAHVGLQVSDFTQKNEDRDSLPLEHTFKFEVPTDESGEYRYFPVSLFSGLEKNPFIADERVSDITFGVNQKYSLSGIFTIPEGYVFEELPKNLRMVTADKDIIMTRVMQATGNKVNYSIVIEFVQPFYVAADYDAFREFNKKMHELLNEQIVIKKAKS